MAKVAMTETIEVSHTRNVRGASKFIFAPVYLPFAIIALMRYEAAEAMTITTRMTKIHTRSVVCISMLGVPSAFLIARRMNEMSATPVTP